jgi:cyclase
LIREAATTFGASTVVVSIEAIKKQDGSYECYTDYGRERSGIDAFEWANKAAGLGAGELLVTSIDREGTGTGFDLELTRRISDSVPIPVIACGGAGKPVNVFDVIAGGNAQAVSLASMLHYDYVGQRAYSERDFSGEGNVEFLKRGRAGYSNINPTNLRDLKDYLVKRGVQCRIPC